MGRTPFVVMRPVPIVGDHFSSSLVLVSNLKQSSLRPSETTHQRITHGGLTMADVHWRTQFSDNRHEVQWFTTKDAGNNFLRLTSVAQVFIAGNSSPHPIPIASVQQDGDEGVTVRGGTDDFVATAQVGVQRGPCAHVHLTVEIEYLGQDLAQVGFRCAFELVGSGRPRFMIPGLFYKENRFAHNARKYPRYDWNGGDKGDFVSDSWSFRADRTALPAVFAWNDGMSAAVSVDETSALGLSGVGFEGNPERTRLWADFPYREEPVVYDGNQMAQPSDVATTTVHPGQKVVLSLRVYVGEADLHSYNPFVRAMYEIHRRHHHLNPWMDIHEAARLTAHGLYRWHFHPEHDILYETAAFDRELNMNVREQGDRPHMHVAWVSGAPYAYALLTYGRRRGRQEYVDAALRVLSKIASGIAPSGLFWAEWTVEAGWGCGWNPHKEWLQSRTIAEATLFLLRAIQFERQEGVSHADWEKAALSNLRFAQRAQREDGNFGSYYHYETGAVEEWDGAGGILWVAALIEGARLFADSDFTVAAERAGEYYACFVKDEFIYGAPEDVHLTPTSEDAYNAVLAYVSLYEENGSKRWLALAQSAADWMMTFRWTYNLQFPRQSLLGQYDFRSRGADHASPSNQHLHNYGLLCFPEMMRLWRYTEDDYYLHRTRDLLSCFLQFIAREDGDFNAYKGMVTERYYNTNYIQPKGMILTLSHAWCIGVILYACQEAEIFEQSLELHD